MCHALSQALYIFTNSFDIFQRERQELKQEDLFWLLVLFLLIEENSLYILGTTYLLVIICGCKYLLPFCGLFYY